MLGTAEGWYGDLDGSKVGVNEVCSEGVTVGVSDDCVTTEVNGVGLLDGSLVGKIVGSKVGAISK